MLLITFSRSARLNRLLSTYIWKSFFVFCAVFSTRKPNSGHFLIVFLIEISKCKFLIVFFKIGMVLKNDFFNRLFEENDDIFPVFLFIYYQQFDFIISSCSEDHEIITVGYAAQVNVQVVLPWPGLRNNLSDQLS